MLIFNFLRWQQYQVAGGTYSHEQCHQTGKCGPRSHMMQGIIAFHKTVLIFFGVEKNVQHVAQKWD